MKPISKFYLRTMQTTKDTGVLALQCLSSVDGRYYDITKELRTFFSEQALITKRVFIETKYLFKLSELMAQITESPMCNRAKTILATREKLEELFIQNFSLDDVSIPFLFIYFYLFFFFKNQQYDLALIQHLNIHSVSESKKLNAKPGMTSKLLNIL